MDKLVKRTAQAQRQVARRAKREIQREQSQQNRETRAHFREAFSELRGNIKASRTASREAWELGPLAARRDAQAGAVKDFTRTSWVAGGFNKAQQDVAEKRCAWAGGIKQLNLAPQDRVVILDGPDKGKIDRIESIDYDMGFVKLENCHKAMVTMALASDKASKQAMPLPVSSVRLVYPITDPNTGATRDVIINQLKAVPPNMQSDNMSFDRWQYGKKWDRLVPSLNVVIPWPAVEVPELKSYDADTTRDDVDERTFHYGLLSPPMPENVLDELRNRYSRFRTRHEPWYIAKKNAEAAAGKGRHELMKLMQTPLEEYHEKQKALREAEGEPELTDDMLRKIGEVMAKNKAALLADAGMTEESSASRSTPTS